MRHSITLMIAALVMSLPITARNKVVTMEKVSTAIVLEQDVDYTITSTTPFVAGGSVDIRNTEHAVLILSNLKPSKALSFLNFVLIDGEAAVQNENCQVKMYGTGSIIMPYGKNFRPLTVYSEQNFKGDSCNTFGLEHAGGYMNTMTAAKLNNRVRSFKLKRGYMVTFSTRPEGRGYSRCFIADDADLEFSVMPDVLDECISSYRVFKWNDAQKKGLASDTGAEANAALNTSWCYDWGTGLDRGIDCETVPHKIHRNWPPTSDVGSSASPHMKTSNEPGNAADDNPETVEEILSYWEDLMRTGKRLCSPSSHDGSLNHLREFMAEIDNRGWRCDILDLHCYWPEWNLNNQVKGWFDSYKRPIWISEFLWGASWNKNGIFAAVSDWDSYSESNQQKNYNVMKGVFDNWNNSDYIERYAYWNSERNCSKIYLYGTGLSILGRHYANMNSGIGYKKSNDFVPTVVCVAPGELNGTYTKKTMEVSVTWTSENGEKTKLMILEQKIDNGEWVTVQEYKRPEATTFSYTTSLAENFVLGTYNYRVRCIDVDGKERTTNEFAVSLSGTEGTENIQYGRIEVNNSEEQIAYFNAPSSGDPVIILGLPSNNNYEVATDVYCGIVPNLQKVNEGNISYKLFPWNFGTSHSENITKMENLDYMMFASGDHQYGDIQIKAAKSDVKIKNDSVWIPFTTPFPEGVTPVVIASVLTSFKYYPISIKIWGVTNEGFAAKLYRQEAAKESYANFPTQYFYYVAATPGQATLENGKVLTVGRSQGTPVDGRSAKGRKVELTDQTGTATPVCNPYILCGTQTNHYDCASTYRIARIATEDTEINGETFTMANSLYVVRQKDLTSTISTADNYLKNGDAMGWIIVSDPTDKTSISVTEKDGDKLNVAVENGRITVANGIPFTIYNIHGIQVDGNLRLKSGFYIVKTKKQSATVFVK